VPLSQSRLLLEQWAENELADQRLRALVGVLARKQIFDGDFHRSHAAATWEPMLGRPTMPAGVVFERSALF
jgi:hypothetical protein